MTLRMLFSERERVDRRISELGLKMTLYRRTAEELREQNADPTTLMRQMELVRETIARTRIHLRYLEGRIARYQEVEARRAAQQARDSQAEPVTPGA
jgi:hypothetical protein